MKKTILRAASGCGVILLAFASSSAHATNGMALSGFGPIAMGLGGAVHAFEKTATNSNPLVGLSSSLSQNSFNFNYVHNF